MKLVSGEGCKRLFRSVVKRELNSSHYNILHFLLWGSNAWRFCRKTRIVASRAVLWSLSCYKELNLTTKPFTGRTLCGLPIHMQNIGLQSSGMRRKQNYLLPSFFAFFASFFSLAGHLVGLILVGKVFRKAFRILGS